MNFRDENDYDTVQSEFESAAGAGLDLDAEDREDELERQVDLLLPVMFPGTEFDHCPA